MGKHLKTSGARWCLLDRLVSMALLSVVVGMLAIGLRPHSSFADHWVEFQDDAKQTWFKHYGLATGKLAPDLSDAIKRQSFEIFLTIELAAPPDGRFQVMAQIDSQGSADPLIIGQWQSILILMSGRDYRGQLELPRIVHDMSSHVGGSVDVHLKFTPDQTKIFIGQKLAVEGDAMPFSKRPNRISIGNNPEGSQGWVGGLQSFDLQSGLDTQVRSDFQFHENNLPKVASLPADEYNLTVPNPGRFPDIRWIGTLPIDQLFKINWKDVVINLIGFIPFGFLLAAKFAAGGNHDYTVRNVFFVTVCGFLLSLLIEGSQTFIAGRSAHLHDLLLNTLGSAVGAISAYLCACNRHWFNVRNKFLN